jgi:hypothetical protein
VGRRGGRSDRILRQVMKGKRLPDLMLTIITPAGRLVTRPTKVVEELASHYQRAFDNGGKQAWFDTKPEAMACLEDSGEGRLRRRQIAEGSWAPAKCVPEAAIEWFTELDR